MTEIDAPTLIPQEHSVARAESSDQQRTRRRHRRRKLARLRVPAMKRSKGALTGVAEPPSPLCGCPSAPADAGPRYVGGRCRAIRLLCPFHQSLPTGCQGDQPRPFGPAAAAASRALLALGNDRPRAYIQRSATRLREPRWSNSRRGLARWRVREMQRAGQRIGDDQYSAGARA